MQKIFKKFRILKKFPILKIFFINIQKIFKFLKICKNFSKNILNTFIQNKNNHKTLWARKLLAKNTKRWWKFEWFCIFWLKFLLKMHVQRWILEEMAKMKFFNFSRVGGSSLATFLGSAAVGALNKSLNISNDFYVSMYFRYFFKIY